MIHGHHGDLHHSAGEGFIFDVKVNPYLNVFIQICGNIYGHRELVLIGTIIGEKAGGLKKFWDHH